ncbi:MAG: hypothetical protein U5K27_19710 [Desulfotignum sp.]|nr:hypothetical protein [Desulfotignum sp.]
MMPLPHPVTSGHFPTAAFWRAVAVNRYAIGTQISQAYPHYAVKALRNTGNDDGTTLERTLFLYVNGDPHVKNHQIVSDLSTQWHGQKNHYGQRVCSHNT